MLLQKVLEKYMEPFKNELLANEGTQTGRTQQVVKTRFMGPKMFIMGYSNTKQHFRQIIKFCLHISYV